MIDILVFALPVDRARAEAVLDGLHEAKVAGPNRTRFITAHPLGAEWMESVRMAEACPCVVFCWSGATATVDAEPFRRLAVDVDARGHALSVELDRGARPSALAGSTTYPLYGWRAHPRGWGRFVFGNRFVMQIAAAAQRKVSGQDPPSPQALWTMVRAQAWGVIVGGFALLGVVSTLWQFYTDPALAKWADRDTAAAFDTAKAKRSCSALRAFVDTHRGNAWSEDARELLATCATRELVQRRRVTMDIVVFGMTRAEVEADSRTKCVGLARTSGGALVAAKVRSFTAGASSGAACVIDQPVSVMVETMGGGAQ